MSVIKIGKQDILKGLLHKEGWVSAEVVRFESGKSKKGDSINFIFTVRLLDETGKEYPINFNTKALGFIVPFVEAITLEKVKEEDLEIDPDNYVGKKLDVEIEHEDYQGRLVDKANNYLPFGKGKTAISL